MTKRQPKPKRHPNSNVGRPPVAFDRLVALLVSTTDNPPTVHTMASTLKICTRTVYRYLDVLEKQKRIEVLRDSEDFYHYRLTT